MTTYSLAPIRITCEVCEGRRTITRDVPEARYSVIHPDGWQGRSINVPYFTGRTVVRCFECPACGGRGTVDARSHSLLSATGTNA